MTGWTERDPRVVLMQVSWNRGALDEFRLAIRDGVAVGYLRTKSGDEAGDSVIAEEVVFPRARDFRAAIRAREVKEKRPYASVVGITCARDRARYRALGYDLYGPMQQAIMAMPLRAGMRARDLPRAFGVPQGRFILLSTDYF